MSAFNPEELLDFVLEESNSTEVIKCPVGDYPAVIESATIKSWVKRDDPSVSGLTLDIQWDIQDEGAKEATGRKTVKVKQGIMLDLLEDGRIDMSAGRNVGLGLFREALNMNQAGQPFRLRDTIGQAAVVRVEHRADKNDSTRVYEEVKRVSRM